MNKNNEKYDLLALGEVLLKLTAPNNERLVRGDVLSKQAGGAELNVIAGSSLLGLHTGMVTKLPDNDIARFIRNQASCLGVSDEFVVYDSSKNARLGVYYYENGAYPRRPNVIYDRLNSTINTISLDDFPEELFSSARCFHTSGITLALSKQTCETTIEMIKRFKAHGTLISFDVNYRANLWSGPEAKACIEEILPYVDIFFCSQDTARLTFLKSGDPHSILKSFTQEYPISIVASTERIVHSPKSHTFGSLVYDAQNHTYYEEEPYRNIEVIDRIGSGDAYISGALYGLLTYGMDCQKAMEYGNATAAIKNTIPGDLLSTSLNEINQIIATHKGLVPQTEMNR